MLNKYPLWKYLLIGFIVVIAAIYASPVLFSEEPALQISGSNASIEPDEALVRRVTNRLLEHEIEARISQGRANAVLIRFENQDDQLKARDVLLDIVQDDYVLALSMAQNTPQWLQSLGARPMNLGLDLRGGVHFLLEVDVNAALEPHLRAYVSSFRTEFRDERLKYRNMEIGAQSIRIQFDNDDERSGVSAYLNRNYPEFVMENSSASGEIALNVSLSAQKLREIRDYAIQQNLGTLRNRVNELGVSEPLVQRQGANRIVVQLPGIQDTAAAKRIIGRTASLEFRLEDWRYTGQSASHGPVPVGAERFPFKDNRRPPVLVQNRVIVTGDRVIDARTGFDENGIPQVNIKLDSRGGKQMHAITSRHVGKRMAVIFVEYKTRLQEVVREGERKTIPVTLEDKYVINVATIQDALGYNFRITGLENAVEAQELALLLRAGALAAPMYFVEERTVGPSLGKENISAGMNAIMFGFVLVMIFMLVYYKVFGLIANVALALNLVLLVAIMALLGATLTLPGMAGFVLLVGMAVDANVIIFSRIKEELANGESPQAAISAGYDRALSSIVDANLTTIAVAGVLFLMATGSVKGFAVTLAFGILCSLFTSIMVTRALVNLVYGGRQVTSLKI